MPDKTKYLCDRRRYGRDGFYATMREILKQGGRINPLRWTLKDSAVLYGSFAVLSTACMFLAGYFGYLDQGVHAQYNYFRMMQGALATSNVLLTTVFSLVGRYQSYKDLADFQEGAVPVKKIVARADPDKMKGKISRLFNKAMAETFNLNAYVSIGLCGLMFLSGVCSKQWGEAVSALFLIPAYWVQKYKDEYANAPVKDSAQGPQKKRGRVTHFMHVCDRGFQTAVKKIPVIGKMPPLMMGSAITLARLLPMAGNAAYYAAVDPTKLVASLFQLGQFAFSAVMFTFKANAPKGGIGRFDGSLLSPATPDALDIADSLVRGRIKTAYRPRKQARSSLDAG